MTMHSSVPRQRFAPWICERILPLTLPICERWGRLGLEQPLPPIDGLLAATALEQIRTVRTIQYPFEPFAHRVWELRNNLTVYDAWYVALAEWLGVEFVTADERLTGASGLRCAVRHLGGGQDDPGQVS